MEDKDLARLAEAVRASWDGETSDTPDRWDPAEPERDQCGPTSLVVHDHVGGDLLHVEVFTEGELTDHHYWNRLPDGTEIDLTRSQFRRGETFGPSDVMKRPTLIADAAQERYELLRSRVSSRLSLRPDE